MEHLDFINFSYVDLPNQDLLNLHSKVESVKVSEN